MNHAVESSDAAMETRRKILSELTAMNESGALVGLVAFGLTTDEIMRGTVSVPRSAGRVFCLETIREISRSLARYKPPIPEDVRLVELTAGASPGVAERLALAVGELDDNDSVKALALFTIKESGREDGAVLLPGGKEERFARHVIDRVQECMEAFRDNQNNAGRKPAKEN